MDVRWVLSRARWGLLLGPVLWATTAAVHWNGPVGERADVHAYWEAVGAVREYGTPYVPLPPAGPHRISDGNLYLYPPPFAALLSLLPVGLLGLARVMIVVNLCGIALMSWAIPRLAGRGGWWWPCAVASLLYVSPVAWWVFAGSVHPLIMGVCMAALLLPVAYASALLTGCGVVTVTPAWAAGVAVGRGRVWWPPLLVLAAALVVSVTVLGAGLVSDTWLWATAVAPTLAQGQFEGGYVIGPDALPWERWAAFANLSPSFALVRALVDAPPAGGSIPTWARAWLAAVQLGVPALTVWIARRFPWNVQAGWVLVAATLSAPILRAGYLPILLLIPALIWRQRHGPETLPGVRQGSLDHREDLPSLRHEVPR